MLPFLIRAIELVPEARKYLTPTASGLLKSIETYDRQLWSYALELYRTGDGGVFLDKFIEAIASQLTRAWNEGAREVGVDPKEMTDDDRAELKAIIDGEYDQVIKLAEAIMESRSGTLDEFRQKFRSRIDLWVNRYTDVIGRARVYFGGKTRLKWTLGKTEEHCETCAALNGIVAFASEWELAGIKPQSPPNEMLACGGWNCDCSLEVTDQRRSPNALDTLMNIATAAHLEEKSIKYSPDQPRVPAGDPEGGQWVSSGYVPNILGNSENIGELPPTEEQLEAIKKRIAEMPDAIKKLEPIDPKHRTVRKLNGETIIIEDQLYVGIMPDNSRYPKPMGTAYSKGNGLYIDEQFIGTPIQDHEYIHTLLFRNKTIYNALYYNKYNPPYYFYHAEWAQNKNGEQITMLLSGYSDNENTWIDNIISSDTGMNRTRGEAKAQITELSRFFKEIGIW